MANLDEFSGLLSNADPNDIPRGAAQAQENVCSRKMGCLQCRHGMMLHKYPTGTDPILDFEFMYAFSIGGAQYVLAVLTGGGMYYTSV